MHFPGSPVVKTPDTALSLQGAWVRSLVRDDSECHGVQQKQNKTKQNKNTQYGTGIKNRHTDHENRLESSEINPSTYRQLIYDKAGKNIQQEKQSL